MAKPNTFTTELRNESSRVFNQKLEQIKDKKVSKEERERLFSLVDRVLAKSKKKGL